MPPRRVLKRIGSAIKKRVAPRKYAEEKEQRIRGLKFTITRLDEQIERLETKTDRTNIEQIALDELFESLEAAQSRLSNEGLHYKKVGGKIVWNE